MDPIRTAVKFSLIPLRTVVQLGEIFVESGQNEPPRSPAPTPAARPRKQTQPRKAATTRQASRAPKDLDDVALARKVETIIFRDSSVPKGKIDVNAAEGVVWLRGEAKNPEMIKTLEVQAAAIPEVRQVENLLHLPKTPAPTRADTPRTQQKTRSSTRRPKPTPKNLHERTTNEGRTAVGEDLPVEAAHEGEGRKPAPLGANGSGS